MRNKSTDFFNMESLIKGQSGLCLQKSSHQGQMLFFTKFFSLGYLGGFNTAVTTSAVELDVF